MVTKRQTIAVLDEAEPCLQKFKVAGGLSIIRLERGTGRVSAGAKKVNKRRRSAKGADARITLRYISLPSRSWPL
jgi:hypothetical protein